MAGFGANKSSAAEAESQASKQDLKKAAADDAPKKSEQKTAALPTPESTPGPDTERLKADKARRETEATKDSKETDQGGPQDEAAGSTKKKSKGEEQAEKSSDAPPDKPHTSTDEPEEFAPNAQGDESSEPDAMQVDESEAPKPDAFRLDIYEKARPFLGQLMENPKDAKVKSELENLNTQIREQNLKDKLPRKDLGNFIIQVSTFAANFETAKVNLEALQRDPADKKARKNLVTVNQMLSLLIERHGYPKDWVINVPPDPKANATGSTSVDSPTPLTSKATAKGGKSSTKGGVKTKIGVSVPDESDGQTSLGQVVYVRKAGHGTRVIVNRGTEENPYMEVHPGAAFGKGYAKDWLKYGTYMSRELPENTTSKQMKIYDRVTVARTAWKRVSKTGRSNNQIQYYLVRIGEEEYVSTRSALSAKKGMSPTKLDRIDEVLDKQRAQVLEELDECRERKEHPDTGERLTNADIEEMPWLSPDAIAEEESVSGNGKYGDGDEEEDDDMEDMVHERIGLKRKSKPAPPIPTQISRTPTDETL